MKITMKDGFVGTGVTFQPYAGRTKHVLLQGTGKEFREYSLQRFVDNWSKGVIRALPGDPIEELDMESQY